MFPSHDAVVSAVPEYARDPLLDELESSTGRFAASHLGVELLQASASRFSSAHFKLSGEDTALQDELADVMAAAGLPPHCGEPEVSYLATLAADPEQNEELADLRTDAEAKVRDRASQLASQGACSPCLSGRWSSASSPRFYTRFSPCAGATDPRTRDLSWHGSLPDETLRHSRSDGVS